MISAFYAAICTFIIGRLSLNVIKVRRKHRINIGPTDNDELVVAMMAQSNAIEYIPIGLILLFSLEFNGVPTWVIHLFGATLVAGRLLHSHAMRHNNLLRRVISMHITFNALFIMAFTNLFYLPYDKFFG